MNWAVLVAAALGGGVVASILEAWYANLRAYETARLQAVDDLDSMLAVSGALAAVGDQLGAEERAAIRYPTAGWRSNFAVMAVRLERGDSGLLERLAKVFVTIEVTPVAEPLPDQLKDDVHDVLRDVRSAQVGTLGKLVVYGPRYAWSHRTGARTGAQAA